MSKTKPKPKKTCTTCRYFVAKQELVDPKADPDDKDPRIIQRGPCTRNPPTVVGAVVQVQVSALTQQTVPQWLTNTFYPAVSGELHACGEHKPRG